MTERTEMDEHQKTAYLTLLDAAEKVRALLTAARSSDHPLTLSDNARVSISAALNGLHSAQRDLEEPS